MFWMERRIRSQHEERKGAKTKSGSGTNRSDVSDGLILLETCGDGDVEEKDPRDSDFLPHLGS